jgi:uncharacterized membrane protein
MGTGTTLLSGAGLGAGLMYFLDPDRGKRRRALVRDQVLHLTTVCGDAMSKTSRDVEHHLQGWRAAARSVGAREQADDDILVARVRSRLGRIVPYAGSIQVSARDGRVTLSGPVLAQDLHRLTGAVNGVRGVRSVNNQLRPHERPEEIPALQGRLAQGPLLAEHSGRWSPTARLTAMLGGSALLGYGLSRGGLRGMAASVAGAGLVTRGLTNMPLDRLLGLDAGRPAIELQKTITISAPVERVYEVWTHVENFPRIMEHVRDVRVLAPDHVRWQVEGPLGMPVEWELDITQRIPHALVAWRTSPDSMVTHTGTVRFERGPQDSTRMDIHIAYSPPAGALGYLLSVLLGADPKRLLDEELVRFKSLMEQGKTHVRGATVTREQLVS